MKYFRSLITFIGLFALTLSSSIAAELASAKVISVDGNVTLYPTSGPERQLAVGDILKEGDSVIASAISTATFAFSNGSTVDLQENSSFKIKELKQEPFSGGRTYDQLEADPSKSQTILDLTYGVVSGHVKKLKSGSKFNIETVLGTAAIRGTIWTVELDFNSASNMLTLTINNRGGLVDLLGIDNQFLRAIDSLDFVFIELGPSDPNYTQIIQAVAAALPPNTVPPFIIPLGGPQTPDDLGVIIVSPEGPATAP